jgi:hypothetical protein
MLWRSWGGEGVRAGRHGVSQAVGAPACGPRMDMSVRCVSMCGWQGAPSQCTDLRLARCAHLVCDRGRCWRFVARRRRHKRLVQLLLLLLLLLLLMLTAACTALGNARGLLAAWPAGRAQSRQFGTRRGGRRSGWGTGRLGVELGRRRRRRHRRHRRHCCVLSRLSGKVESRRAQERQLMADSKHAICPGVAGGWAPTHWSHGLTFTPPAALACIGRAAPAAASAIAALARAAPAIAPPPPPTTSCCFRCAMRSSLARCFSSSSARRRASSSRRLASTRRCRSSRSCLSSALGARVGQHRAVGQQQGCGHCGFERACCRCRS